MKNLHRVGFFLLALVGMLAFIHPISAQGMMGSLVTSTQEALSPEEQAGLSIWNELGQKQISCTDLKDTDFEKLGEYFLGLRLGSAHDAMDANMERVMGIRGTVQMHVLIGQYSSGCDVVAGVQTQTSTQYGVNQYWPMFGMMGAGWPAFGYGYGIGSYSPYSWIFMVLWWAVIITAIVVFVRLVFGLRRHRGDRYSSVLDILKERYAKGEIDKKEFDKKKKDLGV